MAPLILVALAGATLFFLIGLPVLVLWTLSEATDSGVVHFVVGLLAVPLAMALFAPVLLRLNDVYLRVTGDEGGRRHGPLEPMLVGSFLVGLTGLVVWFFFFAHNPPRQFI